MVEKVKIWARVARANFLPTALLPYAMGALYGAGTRPFRGVVFLAGMLGSTLVLLAANLFNEYWDHRLGADLTDKDFKPHFGGSRAIQERLLTSGAVRTAARVCLAFAAAFGVGLSLALKSPVVFILGAAGSFLGWAYTARPLSLAYHGLGEATVIMAFGPLLVSGGHYLQTGRVEFPVLVLSLSTGFLISSLLVINELADSQDDALAGKRNLAVRLGVKKTSVVVIAGIICTYLIIILGVVFGKLAIWFLLLLITIYWSLRVLAAVQRAVLSGGEGYPAASAKMIFLYSGFHLLAMVLSFF